jgi:hypothetical protein
VIANCGQMGLDWRFLSLSGYLEALEAANETTDPKKGPSDDGGSRLAAVIAARGGGNA